MNLKFLLLALTFFLYACGGDSTKSNPPTIDKVVQKKAINTENVDHAFTTYLLYRYRLTREFDAILSFGLAPSDTSSEPRPCSLGGKFQSFSVLRFTFDQCQTTQGKIVSGTIDAYIAVGPAHTTWNTFSDLNYQLIDDTEPQRLNGSYTFASSFRLSTFSMNYVRGTRTESYASDTQKPNLVSIKTTAISGNQTFQLMEFDEQRLAITPILSADDGSNISILIDNIGAASISLRNDKNGSVIVSKPYSKSEVDRLLEVERKAKT